QAEAEAIPTARTRRRACGEPHRRSDGTVSRAQEASPQGRAFDAPFRQRADHRRAIGPDRDRSRAAGALLRSSIGERSYRRLTVRSAANPAQAILAPKVSPRSAQRVAAIESLRAVSEQGVTLDFTVTVEIALSSAKLARLHDARRVSSRLRGLRATLADAEMTVATRMSSKKTSVRRMVQYTVVSALAVVYMSACSQNEQAAASSDARGSAQEQQVPNTQEPHEIPDTQGTGPFPALKEEVASLPQHVVYRPADLSGLGDKKLGVLAWGNGGCSDDGASSRLHL